MKDHVTFAYLLNSAIISFSHRTSWVTRVSYNKKITKEIFFSVSKETSLIFVLTLSGKEWWNVGKENFCRAIFKTPAGRRKRKQYKGNCKAFCVRRKPKNLKFILLWEDSRNSRKMINDSSYMNCKIHHNRYSLFTNFLNKWKGLTFLRIGERKLNQFTHFLYII